MTGTIAGGRYAFQVVHPGSPMLRIRYRRGVAVDPHGFPDWIPYATALVELPPADPALGIDEARVLDVLTANAATRPGGGATPDGWAWAHVAQSRRLALVPAELHGAFRHLGGVSTGAADRSRRGLAVQGEPPPIRVTERLSEAAVRAIEGRLGGALPAAYRSFLARTNGGRPGRPAVHPAFGFVADQPFFGADRDDWLQDLVYANAWFGDRLTADWLAIGYVQGGLIAVRVGGGDEGSVWYCDDDDPRDRDGYDAAEVCARLLHRCADDFAAFWRSLREPPPALLARARAAAAESVLVLDERLGSALPPGRSPAR
jgi:hypothetical protein